MIDRRTPQQKARDLRYQRPMAMSINWWHIQDDLQQIQNDCADVRWMEEDTQTLIDLLDGDEEAAFEFRIAYSDLGAEADRMADDMIQIRTWLSTYMPDNGEDDSVPAFDLFFPAIGIEDTMIGYDAYEGDYFGLDLYESERAQKTAKKRLMRLTKEQIIELAGMCFDVARAYFGVMYRYKSMHAAFEVLKGHNEQFIKVADAIEEAYEKYTADPWHRDSTLDSLLSELPDRLWVE